MNNFYEKFKRDFEMATHKDSFKELCNECDAEYTDELWKRYVDSIKNDIRYAINKNRIIVAERKET